MNCSVSNIVHGLSDQEDRVCPWDYARKKNWPSSVSGSTCHAIPRRNHVLGYSISVSNRHLNLWDAKAVAAVQLNRRIQEYCLPRVRIIEWNVEGTDNFFVLGAGHVDNHRRHPVCIIWPAQN